MRRKVIAGACGCALVLLASTGRLAACPSCPAGEEARAQVVHQDLGTNLLVALAPFLLVGLASRWAERLDGDGEARTSRGDGQ